MFPVESRFVQRHRDCLSVAEHECQLQLGCQGAVGAIDSENKSPAEAGPFAVAGDAGYATAMRYLLGPRCDMRPAAIMKLSKRFSATWNHDTWSARNAFHGS